MVYYAYQQLRKESWHIVMSLSKMICTGLACCAISLTLTSCQQPVEQDEPAPVTPTEINDKSIAATDPFYVLVVGNDSRTGTIDIDHPDYADGTGRSDTMMLARIDPQTYLITLVSIPRDTACDIDGSTMKINEAYHQGGIQAAIVEVEKLTGVSITYYFDTGFVRFEELVNAWGGIQVTVPFDFSLSDGVTGETVTLSEGEQLLDGSEALAFARMRKDYKESQDASRQIQDRQLVENAIMQMAENPSRVADGIIALLAYSDTNWPKENLLALAADFSEHSSSIHFYSGTGPYEGGIDESAGGLWMATRDEETWHKLIQTVDEGGDPTTIVALPTIAPAE